MNCFSLTELPSVYKSIFCAVQEELLEKVKSDAASGKQTVTSTVSSVDEEKDDLLIGQSGILLICSDIVIVHDTRLQLIDL